jgi:hypothetical protein
VKLREYVIWEMHGHQIHHLSSSLLTSKNLKFPMSAVLPVALYTSETWLFAVMEELCVREQSAKKKPKGRVSVGRLARA